MSKIDLTTVGSGFLSQSAINDNFTAIENEFQNKVLYRNNPTGEPNSMATHLDMNGYNIINAGNATSIGLQESENVSFELSATGAVSRSVQSKLADVVSVKDFGAVGDGTTDDTVAITSANSLNRSVFVPNGTYDTTLVSTQFDGPYFGTGQLKDNNNNKRAPYFSAIKAAPSSLGSHNSAETAFNGDISKVQFPIEHRITGTNTLGQPTSGYVYTPEAYAFYGYMYNSSGYNHSTSGNDGRTAAVFQRLKIFQAGQGDCVAQNVSAFVTGAKAGATSFLANPAAVMWNGDMVAGADGVYLNPREIILNDSGYDVACVGDVVNVVRTNSTGALGAYWAGYRLQSSGSAGIDVAFSAIGPMNIGLDLSFATLPSAGTYINAAITLKANQRIYGNVSATDPTGLSRFPAGLGGGEYFSYDSTLSAWHFVVNNTSALQIYANQTACPQHFNISSGKEYRVNSVKVVGGRDTGWAAMTGTTNKATVYDTSTVTLAQLAGRVMALQAALTTHGLIGA